MTRINISYKILLVIAFSIGNYSFVSAKNDLIKKNSINISFSNIKIEDENCFFEDDLPNLQILISHKVANCFSIGGNVGYGIFEEFYINKTEDRVSLIFKNYTNSVSYGINSELHLLPLFIKKDNQRIDLFLSAEIGGVFLNSSDNDNIIPIRGNFFDYSLMVGGTLYLSNTFGLFIESGYKEFKYYNGIYTKYGLSFRF